MDGKYSVCPDWIHALKYIRGQIKFLVLRRGHFMKSEMHSTSKHTKNMLQIIWLFQIFLSLPHNKVVILCIAMELEVGLLYGRNIFLHSISFRLEPVSGFGQWNESGMGWLSRSFKSCHKVVPSFPSTPKIVCGKRHTAPSILWIESFGFWNKDNIQSSLWDSP